MNKRAHETNAVILNSNGFKMYEVLRFAFRKNSSIFSSTSILFFRAENPIIDCFKISFDAHD